MYLPSEYTKNNSPKVVLKDTESVLFCVKKTPKTTKNTPNLQIQKENNKKSNEIRKTTLDDVINNDNNVANIDNIGNSMNRHMQQIDHQTGEVVEGFVAYVVPKRKKRISERMDGNGSRSNDDACSKQFNRQRHEGYVGNACPA